MFNFVLGVYTAKISDPTYLRGSGSEGLEVDAEDEICEQGKQAKGDQDGNQVK